jgi:RNA polymerase sigma-70 factor (ECF subfamily)
MLIPRTVRPAEETMVASDTFTGLAERLHRGEGGAAREVFDQFSGRLLQLARRNIEKKLAHRIEPEDVVQSAFKSFFVRSREGKIRVESRGSLWGLLTLITLRKCADRVEHLRAGRRDIGREVSAFADRDLPWQQALDREPLPQEAVILAETVEQLFGAVGADEGEVLTLCLQGYSSAEIGLQLGLALRSVQRLRERIRQRLERMQLEN